MNNIIIMICFLLSIGGLGNIPNSDYESLWSELIELENEGLFKSAYEIADEIYIKANKEGRDDQLIKSIIYKSKLSRKFKDHDPASVILKFEDELSHIKSESGKAIFHSMLGELYHSYALNNLHRFSGRTPDVSDSLFLAYGSLQAIQKVSVEHFQKSIALIKDKSLEDFSLLFNSIESQNILEIKAESVDEFILYRALRHFTNSNALVSLPKGRFVFNDEKLFSSEDVFNTVDLTTADEEDNRVLALKLFQQLTSKENISRDNRIALETKRIEFVYKQYETSQKNKLYVEALKRLTKLDGESRSIELAYIKIIEYFLGNAESGNENVGKDNPYKEAFRWIQKYKSRFSNPSLKYTVDQQRQRLNAFYLDIEMEKVIPSGVDFLAFAKYRNVPKLHFKIFKLDEKEYTSFLNANRQDEKLVVISELEAIRKWEIDLPGYDDFNYHSIEFPIASLEFGHYILTSSSEKTLKVDESQPLMINVFQISNLSYSIESISNGIIGRVMDRNNGSAVGGARIIVYEQKYNPRNYRHDWLKIDEVRSDNLGTFKYNKSKNNFSFKIQKGDDCLDLRDRHYQYSKPKSRKSINVQIFTDRSIYRPGQKIHFKGIVYSMEQTNRIPKLEPATKLKLLFRDVNYQIVDEYDLKSNAFGSFEGVFRIPNSGLNGSYILEVNIPGNSHHHNVQVEEYRRPKIQAEFEKISESLILGDSIPISGVVNSYTNLKLENVSVNYSVVKREFIYPYSNKRISPFYSQEEVIDYGSIKTGSDGKFVFKFPTVKSDENNGAYFEIECEITDPTGESLIINKSINLSNDYYSIDLKLPEFSLEKQLDSVKVTGVNLEGEMLELDYRISVFEIKEANKYSRDKYWEMPDQFIISNKDYETKFPWDLRNGSEDPKSIKTGKKCLEFKDSGKLLSITKLNSLKSGAYQIKIEAVDKNGNKKDIQRRFYISNPNKLALNEKALWLSPVKKSYEVGEKLEMSVSTPFKNAIIYFQIMHNNYTINSGVLDRSANSIEFEIEDLHRGGLYLTFYMVHHNRVYQEQFPIDVPWSNKDLEITVNNFRDKTMPGTKEEIDILIKQKDRTLKEVELSASLYDSSLDDILPHRWKDNFFPRYTNFYRPLAFGFGKSLKYSFGRRARIDYESNYRDFSPTLNWFGFQQFIHAGNLYRSQADGDVMAKSAGRGDFEADGSSRTNASEEISEEGLIFQDQEERLNELIPNQNITIRENLSELVFFYPQLKPDKDGVFRISYKMNEALTKWKLMLFAHDKSLSTGYQEKFITTFKPIMVQPFLPRFLIQRDRIIITARVSNTTMESQEVKSELLIRDSRTKEIITEDFLAAIEQGIVSTIEGGKSIVLNWTIDVPEDQINALDITITSEANGYSDGEVNSIPVISKKVFLTESLPLYSNPGEKREFQFKALDKLNENNSIDNFQYVLNYQSDPSWVILKSLPYLLNDDLNATTQIFDAYYATIIGRELIGKSPNLESKLEEWSKGDSEDFELNSLLSSDDIELTPWLRDGLEEQERMKNLFFLLDDNQVNYKISEWFKLLKERQLSNGGLSWMTGGRDNWYISQYVLEGIARMKLMGLSNQEIYKDDFVKNLIKYIDREFIEYYKKFKADNTDVNAMIVHYLFVRSHFDLFPQSEDLQLAINHYLSLYKTKWLTGNTYLQSLLGIVYVKSDDLETSNAIKSSLLERLIKDEEVGYYLNDQAGYYWYQLDVEKQSTLIEFFKITDSEQSIINGLKLWLLKNKQLNSWKTSKASASAIYSFYDSEIPIIQDNGSLIIRLPNAKENVVIEQNSSFKRVWEEKDSISGLNKVEIDNQTNKSSWGSVTWQYFQDLDEVESFKETGLKINKEIFRLNFGDSGKSMEPIKDTKLKKGDRLRVKMEIFADRPMEFVRIKDMRGSGTEPTNIISRHKWQDGLSYYENTKDDASYFFIEYLPKGRFVFEYDLVVSHAGNFSGGIATINSMYAPEFISHSSAQKLDVKN